MKMKMMNLLLVFFLGLLAAVHSTPFNTVTEIPAEPEEDDIKEAEAEGLIFEHVQQPLLTTEPSKINTTVQASQQPSFESTSEGSGGASWPTESGVTDPTTTTQSIMESTSEVSGETSWPTKSGVTDPTTTTQSILESTSEVSGETSWPTEFRGTESTTTAQSIFESSADGSGETEVLTFEGSGLPSFGTESRSTVSTTTVMSVQRPQNPDDSTSDSSTDNSLQSDYISSTMPNGANAAGSDVNANDSINSRRAWLLEFKREEAAGKVVGDDNTSTNQPKGHSTPDWIIILAFIVAVAALVALCAAIATRDKWNGPNQTFKDATKTNSSNQKRELEMQTFLLKEEPRENGKEAEYTVIPLEDLPENFSSD